MIKSKWLTISLSFVLVIFLFAGCGGNTQGGVGDNATLDDANAPAEDPLEVGDLPYPGFSAEKLDPAISEDEVVLEVSELIYDRLVHLDGDTPVAGLAASWVVSDDGLTYQFKLRPNAQFIDGTWISTDVVMANFNRWFDPENPLHGGDNAKYAAWIENFIGFNGEFAEDGKPLSKFDGIEKVDNLEFLLHLNAPMDDLLTILAKPEFSILNMSVLASEGDLFATQEGSVTSSGAYYVVNWDQTGLALAENGDYWGNQE